MVFKKETVKSWFTGKNSSTNNEAVQTFQGADNVIKKYNLALQHNSLTQKGWERLLAQSDDGLKAYLTSIKGAQASMEAYTFSLQGNVTGFKKVTSAIKQYNTITDPKKQEAFAAAVGITNNKLGTYLTGLNGSTASMRGYGISLIGATLKTVGLTAATTALNAALTMGISLIIQGVVTAITALIHKSEEISEKAQEAADKISSISDNLKSNIETVENAKKRYAELAQEIGNLGKANQNQGTLNNEEYEEFLDLSNQLAEVFPSLMQNYDENGNAILNLSGNIDTIVSSLDNLIEKEKEVANRQMMEEFPDVFSGYMQDLSKAEKEAEKKKKEFDKFNYVYQEILKSKENTERKFNILNNTVFKDENGKDIIVTIHEYTQALDELGIVYRKTEDYDNLGNKTGFKISVIDGQNIDEALINNNNAFIAELNASRKEMQYAQEELERQKSSVNTYLNTWLESEGFSYGKIKDLGLQSAVQEMLFNFDFSKLPENIDENDWEEVSEYLRRNILFELASLQNDPEILKAFTEIFTNPDLTPDEKEKYFKQIIDAFGEDSAIAISLQPKIEENDILQKQYDAAISKFGKGDKKTLDQFFKDNSINDSSEIDYFNNVTEAAKSATEAIKMYNQAKREQEAKESSLPNRFQNLWDSETFSDAKKDLTKLAKESGVTEKDIKSLAAENEELASLLNESGISAQFAAKCFERVSMGEDGFAAITDDAVALDKALHEMDESLQAVAVAKSRYDKAMEQNDYNTEFENYQEAYKEAMEMIENGEYGKHFQASMLYLLGDDAVNMSIEEMIEKMKELKTVFGEDATNGLEFLDKLYEKREILDGMESSLSLGEDGKYDGELKPEEFEKIAEAMGMTTEEVAACTNALGMFGNYASYDIEKVQKTLQGMSIAVKDGEDSIMSLQSAEGMLSNLGYSDWDIVKIMQDIQEMGNIKLVDFNAGDAESIKTAVSYLKELDMIEIDGKNINVDSLIEHLRNELSMMPEEINQFLTNLDISYDFTDAEGNAVALDKAIEKVNNQETKSVTDEIEETDTAIQDTTESADGLKGVLNDIANISFGNVIEQVSRLKESIINFPTGVPKPNSFSGDGKNSKTEKYTGTLKTGGAKAAGTSGATKTGEDIINELGNETIVDPKTGTYEVVKGGVQFRKIKKGQIVLNHLQTKELLDKGKISSFGKMIGGESALKGFAHASFDDVGGINPGTGKSYRKKKKKKSGSDSDGSDSSADQSLETFNFIEIAIARIEEAISKLKETAEETFKSFTDRGNAYAESIAKITNEISLQEQAYNAYMARANSYGLDEAWAVQVRDGSINIADIADDGLKEQINNYKEWYEKAHECLEVIEELKKTQQELAREKIELQVTKYDKEISRAEANVDRIQNYVDLKESYGGHARDVHYKGMNKYTQKQIDYTIKQNNCLKDLQKTVAKGSEAWYEYQEKIDSNNNSIKQLTKSMSENAAAAAAIAGQTAERKNEKEDTADEKIDTKLSTSSNNERKKKLLRNKITNIDDRQNNLKSAYASSVKARTSYGNKIQNASKKGVSDKNKKLFKTAISCVKNKKAIPTVTINDIVNALKTAKGAEYKSLSTLLSYCNYYNAYKNAEEENKLNYEMYALTAQAEKKALREEQLQSNLDNNQKKYDRNTMSTAETAAGKNHNVDANARLAKANATSYKNSRAKYENDRDAAAKKANFESTSEFKNLKGKKNHKLKNRLRKAIAAIKAGKKIDEDSMKAVKEYCQKFLNGDMTYYYNCEAYNESVENVLSAQEAEAIANAEAYATELQAKREKVANTVAGRDSQNELYSATAANQTTAKDKNSYVDKQMDNIYKNLDTYRKDYYDATSDFNDAKGAVKKFSNKDSKKQKIINDIKTKYVNKNILIPVDYVQKAYTDVSTEFGLACEAYNEALENKNVAEETYNMYEQTSKTEIAALALEKMSNIEKEYSNKQSVYEQHSKRLNSAIDLAQAKGYQVSKVYYSKLIEEEQSVNNSLAKERQDLINSLNESVANGTIEKYSDQWYEACSNIDEVTNSLDESTKSLVEFQNQLRQVEWDNFDYLEKHIKNVSSEISFMIDELSREDLASDEIGRLTDRGNAVAVLRAESYESYRKQAKDYADEISKINKDLAKDPYNQKLLERREELVQSYQDCIKGAQDEKYAIIDLYKQGYEALLEKIRKLISEYEDLLDAEKDAYDYQNDIAEKTKEIANLRKQLQAYAGDISEETRSKVQTLKVSLEEAEKNLKETQYDKYISDTKEMLSDLEESMEQAIQDIIDSLSENFDRLIEDIDTNYKAACETIEKVSTGIGYTPTEDFKELINSTDISTAVTSMVTKTKTFHENMTEYADRIARNTDPSATANGNNTSGNNTNGFGIKKDMKIGVLPDREYITFNEKGNKQEYFDDIPTMHYEEPRREMKEYEVKIRKEYASGSKRIPHDQMAWTQDDGQELIYRTADGAILTPLREGDRIFTNEMTDRLWKLANGMVPGQENVSVPDITKNIDLNLQKIEPVNNAGDVTINMGGIIMNGVNDPKEFEANLIDMMNQSPRVKKVMNNNTIGTLTKGYNSLSGRKYSIH